MDGEFRIHTEEFTLRPIRNPEAMNPDPLPGFVWLATPGKMLHVPAPHPEFRGGLEVLE